MFQKSSRWILFVLLLSVSATVWSQMMQGPPPGQMELLSDQTTISIPFELEQNHIIMQVKVQGNKPLRFVLDTGFPAHGAMLYQTPQVDSMQFTYSGQAMIGGPSGAMRPANILMNASLEIPGVKFTGQDLVVLPLNEETKNHFQYHDGVWGYSLFSRFIVHIDFDQKIITLTQPDQFQNERNGEEIPIELHHNTPFLRTTVQLNDQVEESISWVMDLGANQALSLDVQPEKKIVPPAKALTVEAIGVAGKFPIQIGRIQQLQLGSFKLHNIVAGFSQIPQSALPGSPEKGNLGMEIWRRFHLTIDYKGKRIFLAANKAFADPFEYNMTGFRFYRDEQENLVVESIFENSPATQANIQAKDIITHINKEPVANMSYRNIQQQFRRDSQTITLTIQRAGKAVETRLQLKRLI